MKCACGRVWSLSRVTHSSLSLTVVHERRIIQVTIQRKASGLAGEQHMATNRQENNQDEQSSPWLGFARFLFIVVVTVLLFVLVNSMVRHHFFSGGQMNQHDATGP